MTCPSQLLCSMYADGALAPDEAAAVASHLTDCAACRARVAAFEAEAFALRAALHLQDTDEAAVTVPPLRRGVRAVDLLGLGVGVAALGWAASTFLTGVAAAVPSSLSWLNPLDASALLNFGIDFIVLLANEGSSMLTSISNLATVAAFAALLGGAAVALRKQAGTAALLAVLLAVLALPSIGHAFELRRSDGVTTVAAGETIDDTLLAFGETVSIDGTITGDLIAFAKHVTIRGNVMGDVIGGGETFEVSGTVGGNVFGGGNNVRLLQARVARNVYLGGRDIALDRNTEILGNAVAGGNNVDMAGRVGVDLRSYGFNGGLTVSGDVGRDVGTAGQTVTLVAPARVGRDLRVIVGAEDDLRIADGATVVGTVDRKVDAEIGSRDRRGNLFAQYRHRYATTGFYTSRLVLLATAFVTGLVLLALFPTLRTPPLRGGGDLLKAGVIGLATAIVAPIVAVIVCLTVVLAPLGMIALALGAISLYLAQIPVAQLIGLMLLKARTPAPHYAATLIAGLAVVAVACNLPFIGWIIGLLVTFVGLGMLLMHVLIGSGREGLVR